MADHREAAPENVPGRWYNDNACCNCGLCPMLAPSIFRESADGTHSFVWRQPMTSQEAARAIEVMNQCPVEAIGNDRPIRELAHA